MNSIRTILALLSTAALARAQFTLPPSTADAFDAAQSTTITNFTSGIAPGPGACIGVDLGGPEPGTCFCPNVGLGNAAFIELATSGAVTLNAARLYGKNDGIANGYRRAMSGVRIFADTDNNGSFETQAIDTTIDPNYDNEPANLATQSEYLELPLSFAPVTASKWRVEFVQGTNIGAFEGMRVIEIDAFATCPAVQSYCTSGTTSTGCTASIGGTGTPSASASSGFVVTVGSAEPLKQGILFYGIDNSGFVPLPWGTGGTSFLCVKSPTQRMGVQNTGGTIGSCSGMLSLDWNAFMTANPGSLGTPLSAGQQVFAQGWFRDPPSVKTTSLSNALSWVVCP